MLCKERILWPKCAEPYIYAFYIANSRIKCYGRNLPNEVHQFKCNRIPLLAKSWIYQRLLVALKFLLTLKSATFCYTACLHAQWFSLPIKRS